MSPVIGFARGLSRHPEGLPFTHAWLEAPLSARLARLAEVPEWSDPDVWPAGRIFGEEGEYRWQRLPGGLHGVLLLENGPLPPPFESLVDLVPRGESGLVLWGEWVNPDGDPEGNPDGGPRFYSRDVPEIQTYPIDLDRPFSPGDVPRLVVRRYRDQKGVKGEFIRCVGFRIDRGGDENE